MIKIRPRAGLPPHRGLQEGCNSIEDSTNVAAACSTLGPCLATGR